jgi:hypothetical protein
MKTIKIIIAIIALATVALLTGCSGSSGTPGNSKVGLKVVFANTTSNTLGNTVQSLGIHSLMLDIIPANPAINLNQAPYQSSYDLMSGTGLDKTITLPDPVAPATSEPYLFRITAWGATDQIIYCGQTRANIQTGINTINLMTYAFNGFDAVAGQQYTVSASDATTALLTLDKNGKGTGTSSAGTLVSAYLAPTPQGLFDVTVIARNSAPNSLAAYGSGSFNGASGTGSGGVIDSAGISRTWTIGRYVANYSSAVGTYDGTAVSTGMATFTMTIDVNGNVSGTTSNGYVISGKLASSDSTNTFFTYSGTSTSGSDVVTWQGSLNSSTGLISGTFTGSSTGSGTWSGSKRAATLVSVAVTPANPSIPFGTTQQFVATGTYSDSSTRDLTTSATWSSSGTSVASISTGGLATGVAAGSTTITATSGVISGSTTLAVTAANLVSIAVTPTNPSITVGATQQFTATGRYSDNSTINLTVSVTWSSSVTSTASISTGGLATGVAAGSTTISATSGTITGTTTLTVNASTGPTAQSILQSGMYTPKVSQYQIATGFSTAYATEGMGLATDGVNLTDVFSYYDSPSHLWTATRPTALPSNLFANRTSYFLTTSGWVSGSSGPQNFTTAFNTDGSATITNKIDSSSLKMAFSSTNVSGQTITSQGAELSRWPVLTTAAAFPTGSIRYDMTWTNLGDSYALWASSVIPGVTAVSQVPLSVPQGYLDSSEQNYSYSLQFQSTGNTVNFYQTPNSGTSPTPVLIGSGSYAIITVSGQQILEVTVPPALRTQYKLGGNPIYGVAPNGTVYEGSHEVPGITYSNVGTTWNSVAIQYLQNCLSAALIGAVTATW